MKNLLTRLYHGEEAVTAVEYAIIAAIVGVALIATLDDFRTAISDMLEQAANKIAGN